MGQVWLCVLLYLLGVTFANTNKCGRNIKHSPNAGKIVSHVGYSNKDYPNNLACFWSISVPTGYYTDLRFHYLQLEYSRNCSKDSLTVYGGINTSAPVKMNICGSMFDDFPLVINGNASLKFTTDGSRTDDGFIISYTIKNNECGNKIQWHNYGTIFSHRLYFQTTYPKSQICMWSISAPLDNFVSFEIRSFYLENSTNCSKDSLTFYDGPNTSGRAIKKICGVIRDAAPFQSSRNVTLKFSSDGSVTDSGFMISYKFFNKDPNHCGEMFRSADGNHGSFFSHSGYYSKQNYPNNFFCIWRISAPWKKYIRLSIESFSLQEGGRCRQDRFTIHQNRRNSPAIMSFCGQRRPSSFRINSQTVFLRFTTDRSITHRGFKISYSLVKKRWHHGRVM